MSRSKLPYCENPIQNIDICSFTFFIKSKIHLHSYNLQTQVIHWDSNPDLKISRTVFHSVHYGSDHKFFTDGKLLPSSDHSLIGIKFIATIHCDAFRQQILGDIIFNKCVIIMNMTGCHNIQCCWLVKTPAMVGCQNTDYTLHFSTIQIERINPKAVLSAKKLYRSVHTLLSVGDIIHFTQSRQLEFREQVTITIPSPALLHRGHLHLVTYKDDNTCMPCLSSYQIHNGYISLQVWHFSGWVLNLFTCTYRCAVIWMCVF